MGFWELSHSSSSLAVRIVLQASHGGKIPGWPVVQDIWVGPGQGEFPVPVVLVEMQTGRPGAVWSSTAQHEALSRMASAWLVGEPRCTRPRPIASPGMPCASRCQAMGPCAMVLFRLKST